MIESIITKTGTTDRDAPWLGIWISWILINTSFQLLSKWDVRFQIYYYPFSVLHVWVELFVVYTLLNFKLYLD